MTFPKTLAPDHITAGTWDRKLRYLGISSHFCCSPSIAFARSSELKDGGRDCEFSIEEHEATGVTETAFYVPGIFPTAEAAIEAAVTAGQRKIDSGFEYKSVVEYRQ